MRMSHKDFNIVPWKKYKIIIFTVICQKSEKSNLSVFII